MALTDNPDVAIACPEIQADREGGIKFVLIVETDLELDATRPGYDKLKVDRLIAAVQDHMKANQETLEARIRGRHESTSVAISSSTKKSVIANSSLHWPG